MYELFYADGSASMGIQVILEELAVPYRLIESTIDMSEERPEKQLLINPNGWVPVLAGSVEMYECAAITIFLCDRHKRAGLAPTADSKERALYLQTLLYFSNSVQNAFQLDYYPERFAASSDYYASAQRRGLRRLTETWQVIDHQIANQSWVVGEKFSAADIYLFMLTTWLKPDRGQPSVRRFPNVFKIGQKVLERTSTKLVYEDFRYP